MELGHLMKTKLPQLIGLGVAAFLTVAGVSYTVRRSLTSFLTSEQGRSTSSAQPSNCTTIVTDPNPPSNVRSSPVVAPDNIVGTLKNGTRLAIVLEQEGWLQISAPIAGWVYRDLTVTTCLPTN